jgi:hypothetical protein
LPAILGRLEPGVYVSGFARRRPEEFQRIADAVRPTVRLRDDELKVLADVVTKHVQQQPAPRSSLAL